MQVAYDPDCKLPGKETVVVFGSVLVASRYPRLQSCPYLYGSLWMERLLSVMVI